MRVKKLDHCAYLLSYHLVLVTKYRRRCLSARMLDQLRDVLAEQLLLKGGELQEFNGESDHVRLLIELPPTQALSGVVNSLKTVSSRLLRKWHCAELSAHFRKPVLWSRSYFVSSVGGANLETLKRTSRLKHGRCERPQIAGAPHRPPSLAAMRLRLEGALRLSQVAKAKGSLVRQAMPGGAASRNVRRSGHSSPQEPNVVGNRVGWQFCGRDPV